MKIKAEDTNRDLEYSRPFDVHTWSKHPHVNLFVNKIHDQYGLAESNIGKHNLKKILIDLYLCWSNDWLFLLKWLHELLLAVYQ